MSTSIAHCPTDFTTLSVLLYSLKTTALVYLGKNTFSNCSPAPHSYVSPNQQWDASRSIACHLWAFWGISRPRGYLWRGECGSAVGAGAELWSSRSQSLGQVGLKSPFRALQVFFPTAGCLAFLSAQLLGGQVLPQTDVAACAYTHANASTHVHPHKPHKQT